MEVTELKIDGRIANPEDADTARRLAEVKREWDPEGLIRANHAPATG